jgi:tellurite resistance protein
MSKPPFDEPRDQMPMLREGDRGVLLPAIKLSMVMVSLADGPLNLPEKHGLLSVFYPSLRHEKSPGETLAFLQELLDATRRLPEEYLAKMLQPARNLSRESKRMLFDACVTIAEVDGPMVEEEQAMMRKVAAWVELPADCRMESEPR